MRLNSLLLMVSASVLLAACGGGGSSGSTSEPVVITQPAPLDAVRGFTFAENAEFFALPQQQALDLVASPIFEISSRAARSKAFVYKTDTGGGQLSATCETRSSCSKTFNAQFSRLELSDSSQLRLCNGTPGTGGANDVMICVDSKPFSDVVLSVYLTDGRVLKKTLHYNPA